MRRSVLTWLVLGLLVLVSIWASTAYLGKPHLQAGNFPHEVAGLFLQGNPVSGEAARQQVNQLHGTDISVLEAYIATYAGQGEEATLWLSESASETEAEALLAAMDAGVPSAPAFSGYEKIQDGTDVYYYVRGMGQDHYYFQDDHRVYWLSVKAGDPWQVAREFRRTFRY
ncbi:MAG: hypothetical protein D9V47_07895 [Clostridia bacterium]|nr:MAG: hypothetical protein D9V47_07895 [Clostridia bacterium]